MKVSSEKIRKLIAEQLFIETHIIISECISECACDTEDESHEVCEHVSENLYKYLKLYIDDLFPTE